jgi:hypothetical protein
MTSFTALILVCSAAITGFNECSKDTATQVAQLPGPFTNIAECTREAQHSGGAALPRSMMISEDYIKILCVPR